MKSHHLHYVYLALFFGVLLLYAGCTGASGTPNDYRTGSQGLELRWSSTNPTIFYDGDKATILMEMRNRGADTVVNGKLFYGGFDAQQIPLVLEEGEYFSIDGKSEFDVRGENARLFTFSTPLEVRAPQSRDRSTQYLQVKACYDYRTLATGEICIDSDPNNRRGERKLCTLGVTGLGAQGHPIVVNGAQARISETDLRVTFSLTNSGGGEVFDPQISLDKCGEGLSPSDRDKVHLLRATIQGNLGECQPQNPIRMIGNSGTIVCTWPNFITQGSKEYNTEILIELGYGYSTTIQQQFTVMRN